MSIVIVDYHKGNLLSVERGLVGAGADVVVTDKADVIRAADAVVLPGVGAFADAAASMEEMGQMEAVRAAVAGGAPFLGICLGMHLMFEAGTEHAPVDGSLPRGLGFIEGVVDAMPRTVRTLKMGDTGLWEGSGAPLRPRFRAGTIVAQPTAPHKKKHRLPATQLGGEPIGVPTAFQLAQAAPAHSSSLRNSK